MLLELLLVGVLRDAAACRLRAARRRASSRPNSVGNRTCARCGCARCRRRPCCARAARSTGAARSSSTPRARVARRDHAETRAAAAWLRAADPARGTLDSSHRGYREDRSSDLGRAARAGRRPRRRRGRRRPEAACCVAGGPSPRPSWAGFDAFVRFIAPQLASVDEYALPQPFMAQVEPGSRSSARRPCGCSSRLRRTPRCGHRAGRRRRPRRPARRRRRRPRRGARDGAEPPPLALAALDGGDDDDGDGDDEAPPPLPALGRQPSSGSGTIAPADAAAAADAPPPALARQASADVVQRFQAMASWEASNHPMVLFKRDAHGGGGVAGVDVLSLQRGYADAYIPERSELRQNLEAQGVDFDKDWATLANAEGARLLREVEGLDGSRPGGAHSLDGGYVLTVDNLLKMLSIQLRLRARLPVVVMGETGCGKSSLVRNLCKILGAPLHTLNVHGGMGDREIVAWVERALALPRARRRAARALPRRGEHVQRDGALQGGRHRPLPRRPPAAGQRRARRGVQSVQPARRARDARRRGDGRARLRAPSRRRRRGRRAARERRHGHQGPAARPRVPRAPAAREHGLALYTRDVRARSGSEAQRPFSRALFSEPFRSTTSTTLARSRPRPSACTSTQCSARSSASSAASTTATARARATAAAAVAARARPRPRRARRGPGLGAARGAGAGAGAAAAGGWWRRPEPFEELADVFATLVCAGRGPRALGGGERSVASLRDVARCVKVYGWFGAHPRDGRGGRRVDARRLLRRAAERARRDPARGRARDRVLLPRASRATSGASSCRRSRARGATCSSPGTRARGGRVRRSRRVRLRGARRRGRARRRRRRRRRRRGRARRQLLLLRAVPAAVPLAEPRAGRVPRHRRRGEPRALGAHARRRRHRAQRGAVREPLHDRRRDAQPDPHLRDRQARLVQVARDGARERESQRRRERRRVPARAARGRGLPVPVLAALDVGRDRADVRVGAALPAREPRHGRRRAARRGRPRRAEPAPAAQGAAQGARRRA